MTERTARRFCGVMLLSLFVTLFCLLFVCNSAKAATVGIVCKNIATDADKGVDSLIASTLTSHFGYSVTYLDEDVVRTKAFYDTTFDLVITVGDEVSGLTTNNLDSLGQSTTGWIALGYRQWNEINLGTTATYAGGGDTDTRDYYVHSYVNNINSSHFITRIMQDTINAWNGDAHVFLGLPFPDSCHDIKALIVTPGRVADTAKVQLAVADVNDIIINTDDGNYQAKGRRVFFGLFSGAGIPSSSASSVDSCLIMKVFERAVAWAAKDTLNYWITNKRCASGSYEMLMPYMESSGGTGHIVSRNYPYNYTGTDFDEKVSFLRLREMATLRMFGREYRSIWANMVTLVEKLAAVDSGTTNFNWETHYTWVALKVANRIAPPGGTGSCTFSATCPFSCWEHSWMDTTGGANIEYDWYTAGARGSGIDYYNETEDSVVVKKTTYPYAGVWYSCKLPAARFNSSMLDTTTALGWTSVVTYANTDIYGGGAELQFFNHLQNPGSRPVLLVDLDSFSVTDPAPVIVLSPTSKAKTGEVGGEVAAFFVSVTNSSAGSMTYTVTNDSAWLSTTCWPSCDAPSSVDAVIDYGARPAGTYKDTIRVTCADASNSPQLCVVTLTITGAPPPAQVQKMSGFLRSRQ